MIVTPDTVGAFLAGLLLGLLLDRFVFAPMRRRRDW